MDTDITKHKVFWNQQEKVLLCQDAARLLLGIYCSSKLDALNQAQDNVLPESRRRTIPTLSMVPWFVEGLSKELERLRAAGISPLSERLLEESSSPAPLSLADIPLDQLWAALRPRVVSELAGLLTDVLKEVRWPEQLTRSADAPEVVSAVAQSLIEKGAQALGVPTSATDPNFSGETKKTSVLVVGLKGGQMEEMRREFNGSLDLRFFGADENKEKLRHMCESVDHAIGMTGFISHSHDDILSQRARDYIRCNGGMTRLKDTLAGLTCVVRANGSN